MLELPHKCWLCSSIKCKRSKELNLRPATKTFDIYACDEAKKIKDANKSTGLGKQAVGQLAQIAKRSNPLAAQKHSWTARTSSSRHNNQRPAQDIGRQEDIRPNICRPQRHRDDPTNHARPHASQASGRRGEISFITTLFESTT